MSFWGNIHNSTKVVLGQRRALIIIGLIVLAGAIIGPVAHANVVVDVVGNTIFLLLNNIVMAMTKMFASLTGVFISLLVVVARYNTFLDAPVVKSGWPIVRDLMNMVFIIALLIISAGTVLRLQNYRYNRLLGKLIIMAFLVNFSKFIAVFLLQFAQVVMITFVNAFRDVAFGNFSHMFGLDAVINFGQTYSRSAGSNMSIFITLLAGLAMMIVAFVVMLAITIMLFVRIIALWLLIILSPIAYALRILPNTEKYASQWWSEFTKYAVLGPVLAFFLWISLALVGSTSCPSNGNCDKNPLRFDPTVNTAMDQAKTDTVDLRSDFMSELLSIDRLMTFIVGIIFLLMGLQYAQKSGAVGASFAGKVATTGFGVGATLTGLNAIRDRTLAPVQGYFKERTRRRQEAVAERTAALGMRADQVTNKTIGQIGRGRAAVTSAMGAGARGAWKVIRGKQTPQEALEKAGQAARSGLAEGTRGYRQAQGRIAETKARQQAATAKEFDTAGRSKAELEAMALNQNMNGGQRSAAARQLLENNQVQDDANGRTITDLAVRSVGNVPEQYRKLKSMLAKNNPALLLSSVYRNWQNGLSDAQRLADDIERGEVSLEGFTPEILGQLSNQLYKHQISTTRGIDGRALDPTNDTDRRSAQQMGSNYLFKELTKRAKSQKQLNGWLSPLDRQTRKAIGDGAYFDHDEINSEQKRWLADEGFLGEAYHTYRRDPATGRIQYDAARRQFMTDYEAPQAEQYREANAAKIVENAEGGKLSLSTIGDVDIELLLHKTAGFDQDSIEKMTKDLQVAAVYNRAVGSTFQTMKDPVSAAAMAIHDRTGIMGPGGVITGGAKASFDRSTIGGRQYILMQRGLGVSARGGYFDDDAGVRHNALETMSTGFIPVIQPQATSQFRTAIRVDGGKYKFYNYDEGDHTVGAYSSDAARDTVINELQTHVSVPGLTKLADSIREGITEKVVKAWDDAYGRVNAGMPGPNDVMMKQKSDRARWKEELSPFSTRTDPP
ncbi:MAG: type IV secretion system protein [Patescibacteria group bacterium]